MIYSVHNPLTGLFDYHEGGPATPINDDLPTPQLKGGAIGVAASEAARPVPPGCRKIGQGLLPVGCISSGQQGLWKSTKKTGMPSGMGALEQLQVSGQSIVVAGLLIAAAAAAGYLIGRQKPMGS